MAATAGPRSIPTPTPSRKALRRQGSARARHSSTRDLASSSCLMTASGTQPLPAVASSNFCRRRMKPRRTSRVGIDPSWSAAKPTPIRLLRLRHARALPHPYSSDSSKPANLVSRCTAERRLNRKGKTMKFQPNMTRTFALASLVAGLAFAASGTFAAGTSDTYATTAKPATHTMALSAVSDPKDTLTKAKVVDAKGTEIGSVDEVTFDKQGKPTSLKV